MPMLNKRKRRFDLNRSESEKRRKNVKEKRPERRQKKRQSERVRWRFIRKNRN